MVILPIPEIEVIIMAWISGDFVKAIAMTNAWQRHRDQRVCKGCEPDGSPCTRVLARQARGDYCKRHRHQNPKVKVAVKKIRQQRQ